MAVTTQTETEILKKQAQSGLGASAPQAQPVQEPVQAPTASQTLAGQTATAQPPMQQTATAPQTAPAPPTGLGAAYNPEDVGDQAARLMSQDSPLMQKARASGMQYANQRGLLNSSLAGAAAQSAVLDQVIPMASQSAGQAFERGQQGREFAFRSSEAEKERGFTAEQAGLEREFKSAETEKQRLFEAAEAALERDFKMSLADLDAAIQREKILSAETITQWELASKEAINAATISANDRRGAESVLNNAFKDYEASINSIMQDTKMSREDRNSQIDAAKQLLSMKVDYIHTLYATAMDWPESPFVYVPQTTSPEPDR